MSNDSLIGHENVYTCQVCGKMFTTVDRDDGVTPFMVGHIQFDHKTFCNGPCYSAFYPKGPRPSHIPAPSHEWYKPDAEEYKKLDKYMRRDHVDKGGLLLRKLAV